MGNSSDLHELMLLSSVRDVLFKCCPSLPARLRKVSKRFLNLFTEEFLRVQLPKTFDALELYHSNPFNCCRNGDVESTWLMLVHGLEPHSILETGESLLSAAIQSGSVPTVHMLLERGCSVSSKGPYGYTAMHLVAYTPHLALCEFLIQQGGNLDALSLNGSTPLLIASREGQTGLVECMLRNGADPMDGGDKGLTPLIMAAAEGHSAIVRLLVKYGADINERSTLERRTPLHEAVEGCHIDTCLTILDLGGLPSITTLDADGAWPVDIALALCRPDIAALLKSHSQVTKSFSDSQKRNMITTETCQASILSQQTAS